MVRRTANDRADPEWKDAPDGARRRVAGEAAHKGFAHPVGDLPHKSLRNVLADDVAPELGLGDARAGRLGGEVANEVGARGAEHHGHDDRAGPVGVGDGNPVHLGDRLGEERCRLEEPRGLDTREHEAHRGADSRHEGSSADSRPSGRDRGEVTPLEDLDDARR